jgi:hypothetical protein
MTNKRRPAIPVSPVSPPLSDYIRTLALTVFNDPDPGARLVAIEQFRRHLTDAEHQAAADMRQAGWTWEAIAEVTGMHSRQAAYHRFSTPNTSPKPVTARHRDRRPSREKS